MLNRTDQSFAVASVGDTQCGRDACGAGATQRRGGVLVRPLRAHETGLTDDGFGGGNLNGEFLRRQGAQAPASGDRGNQARPDREEESGCEVRGLGAVVFPVAEAIRRLWRIPGDLGGAPDRVDREGRVALVGDRAVSQAQRIGNDRAEMP